MVLYRGRFLINISPIGLGGVAGSVGPTHRPLRLLQKILKVSRFALSIGPHWPSLTAKHKRCRFVTRNSGPTWPNIKKAAKRLAHPINRANSLRNQESMSKRDG